MIRLIKVTALLRLGAEDDLRLADVSFGPQSVLFSSADRVICDKQSRRVARLRWKH